MDIEIKHRIDLHVHDERQGTPAILQDILKSLGVLKQQGASIMGKVDDLRTELAAANEVTNEIASDVEELVRKAAEGQVTEADVQAARALGDRLRAVAAAYTADAPTGGGDTGGGDTPTT